MKVIFSICQFVYLIVDIYNIFIRFYNILFPAETYLMRNKIHEIVMTSRPLWSHHSDVFDVYTHYTHIFHIHTCISCITHSDVSQYIFTLVGSQNFMSPCISCIVALYTHVFYVLYTVMYHSMYLLWWGPRSLSSLVP